ncbi:MAG: carotenoid 1,2-hydratase [Caldilineaceae bacterium]|nr:carotenoid 1,2-hydratase [Caldilineaceae bacterium]
MRTHQLLTLYLLLLTLLAACAAPPPLASANVVGALSGPVDASFARAFEPVEFAFPGDHGPHDDFATEWWYYTGNLTGADGGEYGYQLTFFRSALAPGQPQRTSTLAATQLYMAHFALTSGPANEHRAFDRFSRGAGGLAGATGDPLYAVWLEDWRAEQTGPDSYRLTAQVEGPEGIVALDLALTESQPPLLHGDRGLSQKGPEPGNASYYYSLVRLESQGSVTLDGVTTTVNGLSWMDHEFGTSALSGDALGWDWFAATLDNGAVLMFAQVRSARGQPQEIFEGTLRYADGRQVVIRPDDFTLTPTSQWSSPTTGIAYPSGWQVSFPAYAIDLTIEPLIPDQEMGLTFNYYEGATTIRGTMEGAAVGGRGYVELTGYGSATGGFQR